MQVRPGHGCSYPGSSKWGAVIIWPAVAFATVVWCGRELAGLSLCLQVWQRVVWPGHGPVCVRVCASSRVRSVATDTDSWVWLVLFHRKVTAGIGMLTTAQGLYRMM